MRIVFMGTGDIALPSFGALLEHPGHDVRGLVTQPDKPVGRKQVITPPQIKVLAESQGIPVQQPPRVRRPAALEALAALDPEVIVVMAYGQILPKALLDLPSVACLNLHASLLPRHRGAAPIQAAIRDGDAQSGVTVMYVDEGLDTGDILLQHPFDLAADETGGSLHDRLAEAAPAAMLEALDLLADAEAPRIPQDEAAATHTGKLTRADGVLQWSQTAKAIERRIRAFDPWPGTTTSLHEEGASRGLKVFPPVRLVDAPFDAPPGSLRLSPEGNWQVATGQGTLELSQIQFEGKRRMSVQAFAQGHRLASDAVLGAPTDA